MAESKGVETKTEVEDKFDPFSYDEAFNPKLKEKDQKISKSNVVLDIKPWDDETDMKQMEENVRAIQMDGLVWGAARLVPLAYGICKLQISCVVNDDIVNINDLVEKIEEMEDLVQSVDVSGINKLWK